MTVEIEKLKRQIWIVVRIVLVATTVYFTGSIAWTTRTDVQPDEAIHIDAFGYFETSWQRPEPGSDAVRYSDYGWSRVFTGEVVYEVYGKVGRAVKMVYTPPGGWSDTFRRGANHRHDGIDTYRLYRLINVALLAITLICLMFARCRWFPGWALAATVLAIPQCSYVYSYANSDGWGLSACLLLFLNSAQLADRNLRDWTALRLAGWALLVVSLLLSKTGFLAGIVLPVAVLVVNVAVRRSEIPGSRLWWIGLRFVLPLLMAYAVASVYQPYIRPSSAEYRQAVRAAKEKKALPEYRGEVPRHWGSNLAGKGYTIERILTGTPWINANFASFYGQFGGWSVAHPQWTFDGAILLLVSGIIISCVSRMIWSRDWLEWISLAVAPMVVTITWCGSLWHSLHIDFQPQGRYLFASVVPLAIWWAGGLPWARWWWRLLHFLVIAAAVALSFWVLWHCGVMEPSLRLAEV